MKLSLRKKLMILLFSMIAFITLALALLNNYALEFYYRDRKQAELRKAYERMDGLIQEGKKEELSGLLEEYSYKYNITVVLVDSLTSQAIVSNERDGEYLLKRAQDILFNKDESSYRVLEKNDNYQIVLHHVSSMNRSFIELLGYAGDNQTMVLMSGSVENLKESVALSNRFLAYIAAVALCIAFLLCIYMSLMITKPIKKLAAISEKMGDFDFDVRYDGKNNDEIGVLGNNMNRLSGSLKKAFEELKLANAKLQEDIQKKEEIDKMRRDFVANVSHELKTPIALIQGYAEGLNEGLCEDEESRRYYTEVIIDEANKMNVMVRQLLSLSALESGMQTLDLADFDISELVEGVLSTTGILLADKQVELVYRKKAAMVRGDEFKIEELLTNYISNAMHHVSENGRIVIDTEDKTDKIRVKVFNTGKRIPEEDLANLWEKFYKVDKAHSRTYGGTGIGLSIVKAIAEAHGNECGVYNVEDGVEFWFDIDKA